MRASVPLGRQLLFMPDPGGRGCLATHTAASFSNSFVRAAIHRPPSVPAPACKEIRSRPAAGCGGRSISLQLWTILCSRGVTPQRNEKGGGKVADCFRARTQEGVGKTPGSSPIVTNFSVLVGPTLVVGGRGSRLACWRVTVGGQCPRMRASARRCQDRVWSIGPVAVWPGGTLARNGRWRRTEDAGECQAVPRPTWYVGTLTLWNVALSGSP